MFKTSSSFYFSEYDGTVLNEDNVENALYIAAVDIFNMCNGKEPRTDFQKDLYQRAICKQAEVNETADNIPAGMTSFSIDGMSYSFDTSKTSGINKDVKKFLLPTGLLNRCL